VKFTEKEAEDSGNYRKDAEMQWRYNYTCPSTHCRLIIILIIHLLKAFRIWNKKITNVLTLLTY